MPDQDFSNAQKLPPYIFGQINALKHEARLRGDAHTGNFMGQSKNREELFKYIAKEFGEGRYEVVDRTTN